MSVGIAKEEHHDASDEACNGRLWTDSLCEDTHHEETAETACEESEEEVELIPERSDIKGCKSNGHYNTETAHNNT